jgi:hypothetical protein
MFRSYDHLQGENILLARITHSFPFFHINILCNIFLEIKNNIDIWISADSVSDYVFPRFSRHKRQTDAWEMVTISNTRLLLERRIDRNICISSRRMDRRRADVEMTYCKAYSIDHVK